MPYTRYTFTKTNNASASYLTCSEDSVGDRFGFNGQEKDNEITGIEGSHNTAEFWMYDTRLGRRWNVDPVYKSNRSNYSTLRNNPIIMIDPKGDTDYYNLKGEKIGEDKNKGDGRIILVTSYDAQEYVVNCLSNAHDLDFNNPIISDFFIELPSYNERQGIKNKLSKYKEIGESFKFTEYGGFGVTLVNGENKTYDFKPGPEAKIAGAGASILIKYSNVIDSQYDEVDEIMRQDGFLEVRYYWHTHPEGIFVLIGGTYYREFEAPNDSWNEYVPFVNEPSEDDKQFSKDRGNVLGIIISLGDKKAYFHNGFSDKGNVDLNFFYDVKEGDK